MREILFRGQTRKYGEKVRMGDGDKLPGRWVYGGVLQGAGDHSIIYGGENVDNPSEGLDKWCVHSDTLGQFTGLTDKNCKKIFEGDVIRYTEQTINGSDIPCVGKVEFSDGGWAVNVWYLSNWLFDSANGNVQLEDIEVIGNIHDNPELLEV